MAQPGRSSAGNFVERPWGGFQIIGEGPGYLVKVLTVKPGGILSKQSHKHRSEVWTIARGLAEVDIDDAKNVLSENDTVNIPVGIIHRVANCGHHDLEIVEVQFGQTLSEEDIVRYEDAYGRA